MGELLKTTDPDMGWMKLSISLRKVISPAEEEGQGLLVFSLAIFFINVKLANGFTHN